jgi:Zn-dependent metalloprotease
MRNIIILIFAIVFSFEMQAQLKTVTPGNSAKTTNQTIVPPASKRNIAKVNKESGTFQPKTLDFVKNFENGLSVEMRSKTNKLPIYIKGQPSLNLREGNDAQSRSFNFLDNAKGLMDIQNPIEEFRIIKSETDELGFTHVKLQQEIKGIPIYGSEVIYHYTGEEAFLNGRYTATPNLDSYKPSLELKTVEEIAIDDVGGVMNIEKDKFGLFNIENVTSELVIYNRKLAYHLSVYKSIIDLWEYFIDANTGEIIHKHTSICKFHNHSSSEKCEHNGADKTSEESTSMPPPDGPVVSNAIDLFGTSREINTYQVNNTFYMIDASKPMFDAVNSNIPEDPAGAVWTIDAFNTSPQNDNFQFDHVSSNSSSFAGKQTGVSAQYNGGQAYLYFKNIHGRESINGNGGNVVGLINIADEDGSSLGNAFWNGIAMFYGNGDSSFKPLARGLDVAGHEMSHGVIQSTANLVYQGESGALNESFADVFGAMIDRADWLIGEDVVESSAFPSGALRSLQDPHNGAQSGNFNAGWQPKKYSERFTGTQDNGGVHINSGIPNHAFYLFADDSSVGKNRAEKVYYRALDKYITKSSQFIDARLAIVQAADDLYGANVANKAKAAFDGVEIFDGNATNNQTDVEVNPGLDLILFTTADQNNLYISDSDGNLIFNPLTEQNPISVPSITDDGSEIIFVNENKELYYIRIDWSTQTVIEEVALGFSDEYRNVVFSKDGLLMAALRDNTDNEIFVFDWVTLSGTNYELFNPTFSEGVSTGDVLYADVMEFDFSGEYLIYDAFNEIESTFGDNINYWDIGFIKVFENDSETFTLGTDIQKLFTQLPEGVSIGNPSFSKNSNYIVAFDFIENEVYDVLGVNTETNEVKAIFTENDRLGYPNYSNDDDLVIFNALNSSGNEIIAAAQLEDNKIESNSASVLLGFESNGIKWGVWFGNGDRILASEEIELPESVFSIYPNPASQSLSISSEEKGEQLASVKIIDMMGRTIYSDAVRLGKENSIDISSLQAGQYVLTLTTAEGRGSKIFVKH